MNIVNAQGRTGFEAYYYSRGYSGPRVYLQDRHNWYAEARYNYEDVRTFSFYAGRTFAREDTLSYSITPLAGVLTGGFHGGSFGTIAELDYRRISFYTSSQYVMSATGRQDNFLFSWTELGYQFHRRLYAGVVLQQTVATTAGSCIEPGLQVNLGFGDWQLPVYLFNPTTAKHYFVIGVSRDWKITHTTKSL